MMAIVAGREDIIEEMALVMRQHFGERAVAVARSQASQSIQPDVTERWQAIADAIEREISA